MNIIIEREKWNLTPDSNLLLNCEGKRCVNGFLAQAYDIPDEEIYNRSWLPFIPAKMNIPFIYKPITWEDKSEFKTVEIFLMSVNDRPEWSQEKKEKTLTKFFKKVGIKVEFIVEK